VFAVPLATVGKALQQIFVAHLQDLVEVQRGEVRLFDQPQQIEQGLLARGGLLLAEGVEAAAEVAEEVLRGGGGTGWAVSRDSSCIPYLNQFKRQTRLIVLIIDMLARSVRRLFSFVPERSSRFFTLSLELKPDIPLSGRLPSTQKPSQRSTRNKSRQRKRGERFC
jgi:hypothetical protein